LKSSLVIKFHIVKEEPRKMAKLFILFACVAGALSATVVDVLKTRREPTLLSLIQAAGLEQALSGDGMSLN
jgi:hypothetical protein